MLLVQKDEQGIDYTGYLGRAAKFWTGRIQCHASQAITTTTSPCTSTDSCSHDFPTSNDPCPNHGTSRYFNRSQHLIPFGSLLLSLWPPSTPSSSSTCLCSSRIRSCFRARPWRSLACSRGTTERHGGILSHDDVPKTRCQSSSFGYPCKVCRSLR